MFKTSDDLIQLARLTEFLRRIGIENRLDLKDPDFAFQLWYAKLTLTHEVTKRALNNLVRKATK